MTRRDFFKRLAAVAAVAAAVPLGHAVIEPEYGLVQLTRGTTWHVHQLHPAQVAFFNDPRPRVLWQGGR